MTKDVSHQHALQKILQRKRQEHNRRYRVTVGNEEWYNEDDMLRIAFLNINGFSLDKE